MKRIKNKKIILLVLIFILLLGLIIVGKRFLTTITYSNLTSQDSLNYVISALEKSRVSKESIDIFSKQVKFTNDFLKDLTELKEDFVPKKCTVLDRKRVV